MTLDPYSINLFKTGVVQESRIKTGYPLIHGIVYELKDGRLKELNLDLLGMRFNLCYV